MKLGGLKVDTNVDSSASTASPLGSNDKDGLLRLEVAERMLKWHAEAIGRMVELSVPADVCVASCRT